MKVNEYMVIAYVLYFQKGTNRRNWRKIVTGWEVDTVSKQIHLVLKSKIDTHTIVKTRIYNYIVLIYSFIP